MPQKSNLKVIDHSSCMSSILEIEMQELESVGCKMINVCYNKEKPLLAKMLKGDELALSAKGSRLNGGSCSKYSNTS